MTHHNALPHRLDDAPRQVAFRAVVGAPATEIFALLANPYRHGELDGSGTVGTSTAGPRRVAVGDTFTVRMKKFGMRYSITSTVTAMRENELIEWQPSLGHRWRWELRGLDATATEVTETFDYRDARFGAAFPVLRIPTANAHGIDATLRDLQRRFAG